MDLDPQLGSFRRTHYPEIGTPEVRRQIGKDLKSAREFQEMSLEQVMAITKINVRFLESIEEGKWGFLPPTYVKAFIRAYSSAVGLGLDKLSNRLDELFSVAVMPTAKVKPTFSYESEQTDDVVPDTEGGMFSWADRNRTVVFFGIVAIIAVLLIAYYLTRQTEAPQAVYQDTQETNDQKAPAPVDTARPVAIPVKPDTTKPKATTFKLKLTSSDTCYVKIEHNDAVIFERTLWPGNHEELQPPYPVRMSLGNAPGIRLEVNGDTLAPFPNNRRLRVFQLGPDGITGG
jgi:cytoskeletal protein RodZ